MKWGQKKNPATKKYNDAREAKADESSRPFIDQK
jgi:hypothetical protein